MDWDFEARTSEALADLERGETVEAILSRYPEDADTLRPILEMAHELQTLPLAYSVASQQASRAAMLAEARRLRSRPAPAVTRFSALRRLSFAFGTLLVLCVAAAALLAQPVSAALPGQALYPLKRAAESLQLRLAANPAPLETRFREERREELLALLETGEEADVDCFGTIRTFSEDRWQTGDFDLRITAASTVTGEPAVGAPFEGRCVVRDGQVSALDVRITGPGKLPPELPTPSPLPPTPTPTVTPEETVAPTPTATVTPEAAVPGGPVNPVATPEDGSDDNGDDSDDGGGDDTGDDSGGSDDNGDDRDDGGDDTGDDSGGSRDEGDPDDDGDGSSDDDDSDGSEDDDGGDD